MPPATSGYFNIQYKYNGKDIPFTYLDLGTEVQLLVNDQPYEPKDQSHGPFGGVVLDLKLELVTPNDGYLKFVLTNTNKESVRVKLGTYTDIGFWSFGGNNKIYPFDSKPKTGRVSPGKFLYAVDEYPDPGQQETHPSYQRCVFDHLPVHEGLDFIVPDGFWYGLTAQAKPRFFKKFDNENQKKVANKEGGDDLCAEYSFPEQTIGPDQVITYGIHIFFIMETELDIIAEKIKVAISESESQATITTWMRLLKVGTSYTLNWQKKGEASTKQSATFNAGFATDRYAIKYNPSSNNEIVEIWFSETANPSKKSNVLEVTVTKSTKPILTVQTGTTITNKLNQNSAIELKMSITSENLVTVHFDLYQRGIKVNDDGEKESYNLGENTTTKTDIIYNFKCANLRSGPHILKVYAVNSQGLSSDVTEIQFTMQYLTQIDNLQFTTKYAESGGKVVLTGRFRETDIQQKVRFHVQFGTDPNIAHGDFLTPTGDFQPFSMDCNVPKLSEGKYNCTVWATVDESEDQISTTKLELTITTKPQLIIQQRPNPVYATGDLLVCKFVIKDENQGTVHWKIGELSGDPGYKTDGTNPFSLEIRLDQLKYRNSDHVLKVYVTDTLGIDSDEESFSFKILNKPTIQDIVGLNTLGAPGTTTQFTLRFTDADEDKVLYLFYRNVNTGVKKFVQRVQSNSQPQDYTINDFTYPNTGRYPIQFFLSIYRDENHEETTNSDSLLSKQIDLVCTLEPSVTAYFPPTKIYGNGEKIGFKLTIKDDSQGTVHYSLNNNKLSGDKGIPTGYTIANGREEYFDMSFTIPSGTNFKENGGTHKFEIWVVDEFDRPSNKESFEFRIVNKPEILTIKAEPVNIRSDTTQSKTITISGNFKDLDRNKDLFFYVREGKSTSQHGVPVAKTMKSEGKQSAPFSFQYTISQNVNSYKNLELVAWVEDDNNPDEDGKNGQSDEVSIFVNVSSSPSLSQACPKGPFGLNEVIPLKFKVNDDTNGHVTFLLDNENLNMDLPYAATNGQTSEMSKNITLSKPLSLGKHAAKYYPIDEFGLAATSTNQITCEFQYMSQPVLSGLSLNQTSADNDETVTVKGTLTDSDQNKLLYIMQQFEGENPIEIGQVTTNGGSKPFEFPLKNLINQKSGDRKISFYATDKKDGTAIRPSEKTQLSIKMENDPLITLDPSASIIGFDEKLKIIFYFTTDYSFSLDMFTSKEALEKGSPIYYHVDYNPSSGGSDRYTREFKFDDYGEQTVYFKMTSPKLSKPHIAQYTVIVRDAPVLNSITLLEPTAEPGGYVNIKYSFNPKGNNQVYFFAIIDGIEHRSDLITVGPYTSYAHKFQIDLDERERQVNVKTWMQSTPEHVEPAEKNSRSIMKDTIVMITKTPEVRLDPPNDDFYATGETMRIGYEIKDEGEFNITCYVDNVNKASKKDNANGNWKIGSLNVPLDGVNYYTTGGLFASTTHKLRIEVTDPYGSKVTKDKVFYIRNPTEITNVVPSKYSYVQDETFLVTYTYNDLDEGKFLKFFCKVGNEIQALNSKSSRGRNGQTLTFGYKPSFAIPPGVYTFEFFISVVSNPDFNNQPKNGISRVFSVTIQKTFKPTLTLNAISPLKYTPNSVISLSGKVSGDGDVTLKFYKDGVAMKQTALIEEQNDAMKDFTTDEFVIPSDYTYGSYTITVKAQTKTQKKEVYESEGVEIQFQVMNKPSIGNIEMYDTTVDRYSYIAFTGQLTDSDKEKPIYFFGQFEDEQPFRFNSYTTTSSGGSEPQDFSISTYLITPKVGNVNLNVWASSSDKTSGLERFEVSNVVKVKFYINSPPIFYVTFTPSEQYQYMTRNSNIQMHVYIKDDKNVVLNFYLDSKKFKTENIDVSQGTYSDILTYTIPADESYQWHTLTLECVDNYGTKAQQPYSLIYYVMDQPKILNATFEPSYALQGETTKIRVQYTDLDTHKTLFFWAQFGDQLPETPFYSEFSAGGNETQEFVAGITIPAKISVGVRTIKIWCDDYQNPEQTEAPFASAKFSAQLQVTYTPSLEITQPSKTVYKDGDQIVFNGEINANNNVVLKYSIGDKELSETTTINVETAPQPFTAKVTIPVDYKFGQYSLNIYGVDTNGLKTGLKKIDFILRNPPRFVSSNLVNDVIKQGDPLLISLTVRDPDVGDDIKIYTAIDDQPEQLSTTLQSTGSDMTTTISVVLPYDITIGDHKVIIHLEDQTKEASSQVTIAFTVASSIDNNEKPSNGTSNANQNTANKTSKASLGGIYAGIAIVCLVLIALLVVGAVLLIKKKGSSQPQDSVSDHSDLEERETQVLSTATSVTPDEVATHDNPLFSTNEIAHDNDPFSDEFEEQPI